MENMLLINFAWKLGVKNLTSAPVGHTLTKVCSCVIYQSVSFIYFLEFIYFVLRFVVTQLSEDQIQNNMNTFIFNKLIAGQL